MSSLSACWENAEPKPEGLIDQLVSVYMYITGLSLSQEKIHIQGSLYFTTLYFKTTLIIRPLNLVHRCRFYVLCSLYMI